ncbi:probable disease resistance protein RF9 [Magnolia sinica]|uniref:probable disease resistance protein RF9 n=1 Tax=Magnolia sinica TaxID=86752 RepID=UPI002659A760|nr:probable disease resistance protein RF9 [Magnolia sinica]
MESIVQLVIQKLNDVVTKEADLLFGVDDQIISLRTKLEWMRAFLEDVDSIGRENKRFKIWVTQIRDVAYDAEDVIDSYIFNIEQKRAETSAGLVRCLSSFGGCIKAIPAIHEVGKKILNLERRLGEIKENISQYGVGNISVGGEASSSSNQSQLRREKMTPIDVVGFEDETETLVRQLTEGDARRAVISITGMGGIGKSTLAKKVYNDIHVKKSFDFHAWVYVSQQYLVRELLLSIIKCFRALERDDKKMMTEEDLRQELSQHLQRKRYLVVIDDIWSRQAWDSLVSVFPDTENGSRVLLTTRNEDVARHADAQSTPHKLRLLDGNESWSLFCKRALPGNLSPTCPPNLEELGRKMVAKCGGLPLGIAVLGGVLSIKEKSVNTWEKVLKSVEWWLHESKEDEISGILALSYHDMPCYLKPCFLYFGAFPEDSEINVRQLIQLWIAEGFVQRRGEEEMEDVAEDYLDELISRSMIQVASRESNGTVFICRIHDLLRDLSISEAKEERFLEVHGNMAPELPTKARRLAITCGDISKSISLNRSTPQLRSLLRFSYEREMLEKPQLKILLGAFKLLRVMDLQFLDLSRLPDEIGYLIHLRYLRLRGTGLERLPSTITRLSNLPTLDLWDTNIITLPDDIWKMEQIRHLLVGKYINQPCRISNIMQIHRLSNLQTLKIVEGGSWIEDGLEKLTNLRDLTIRGDLKMSLSHSICKLVRLRNLWVEARADSSIPAFASFSNHHHLFNISLDGSLEKLPDVHEFPPNLTSLLLEGSQLERDQIGTLEMLPNLRRLCLFSRSYVGKEMVCSVGGFPLLDYLTIYDLDELEEWRVEEGSMPNLRHLKIWKCRRLKMLPDGLQHISTLQKLKVRGMPEEFGERARKDEGDDWHKIRHIPSLIINDC